MTRFLLFIAALSLGLSLYQPDRIEKEFSKGENLTSTQIVFAQDKPPSGSANPEKRSGLPAKTPTGRDDSIMMLVPEGPFIYGIKKEDRNRILKALSTPKFDIFDDEFEEQKKDLPPYHIDKFEVTNQKFKRFVAETNHRKPRFWTSKVLNQPNQPVVGIGWADAETYCKWAGKRLPTEEEWEKAARGTDGRIWPWGNKPSANKYNGRAQGYNAPIDVGSFESGASPYGVMDMAGNVYEMTTGKWPTAKDADGRAIRGGSFLNRGALTRTMFRWAADDEINGTRWLGFRCVIDATDVQARSRK